MAKMSGKIKVAKPLTEQSNFGKGQKASEKPKPKKKSK